MITPTSGSISIPAQTADGIWINRININAPSPDKAITATIQITPYNISSGEQFPTLAKSVFIKDLTSASLASPDIANAMNGVFTAVQAVITNSSLF